MAASATTTITVAAPTKTNGLGVIALTGDRCALVPARYARGRVIPHSPATTCAGCGATCRPTLQGARDASQAAPHAVDLLRATSEPLRDAVQGHRMTVGNGRTAMQDRRAAVEEPCDTVTTRDDARRRGVGRASDAAGATRGGRERARDYRRAARGDRARDMTMMVALATAEERRDAVQDRHTAGALLRTRSA